MNLWQRINAVMKDVEYLNKDDTVSTGGSGSYKGISEEKVTAVVGAALRNHGLSIFPIEQEHIRTDETVKDKYGNDRINRITTVNVKYKMINIDNPEEFEIIASSGTGVDTQDKGVGKAMTYAYKYLLLRTFAIATGEDADKISSEVYTEKLMGGDKGAVNNGKEAKPDNKESKPTGAITKSMVGRFYALAKGAGYEAAKADEHVMKKFKKPITELTREEYDAACTGYENKKAEHKEDK